jgi:hypothetical protein
MMELQRFSTTPLGSPWLTLAAILTVVVCAQRLNSVARLLLYTQTVFWSLGYLLRATILLVYQPRPAKGDTIADPRLANGGYGPAIHVDLVIANVSIISFAATIALLSLFLRQRRSEPFSGLRSQPTYVLWILYLLGWLGRIAALAAGQTGENARAAGAVISTLWAVASAAAFALIVSRDKRWVALALMLGACELSWAVLDASKTPIFGLIFALALKLMSVRAPVRRLGFALVSLLSALVFFLIQLVKHSAGILGQPNFGQYPSWLKPVLTVEARFDLLAAVTDAADAHRGSWLSYEQFFTDCTTTFVPRFLTGNKGLTEGQLWAQQVRPLSIGVVNGDVSLAQGPGAEGYVVGGLRGVVLFSVLAALFTVGCSWLARSRSVVWQVLSVYLCGLSVLAEGGIYAIAQAGAKGLQLAVAAGLAVGMSRLFGVSKPVPAGLPEPQRALS